MKNKNLKLVTSTTDLFNAADGSGFFVARGQVKELPEELTPIIEDAIEQGLLIEPTPEEISRHNYVTNMEMALKERKFTAGKNYEETVKRYQKYLDEEALKEVPKEKEKEVPKEKEKEVPKEKEKEVPKEKEKEVPKEKEKEVPKEK